MKKVLLIFAICVWVMGLKAQNNETSPLSIGDKILEDVKQDRLTIGGYGEIHYNQKVDAQTRYNGNLDVHRMVLFLGYQFSNRVQFVTEIEYEHVKELYVEQAFMNYNVANNLSLRGGLMLVPMGIVNEYHEPTTFNGVERPNVDKYIVPSTWREVGVGINGRMPSASLKYQLYLMNGFDGFDGGAKFSASNGLRKGRQKGAESTMTSPSIAGKVDFYGVKGLNLGFSGYFGKSQSSLFDGLDKNNVQDLTEADSSRINVNMIGLDARYRWNALQVKGQYIHSFMSNVGQYNKYTGADVGSQMMGYYLECSYDLLHGKKQSLMPFVRYESYNTQHKVAEGFTANAKNDRTDWTFGVSYHLAKGAVVKADYQRMANAAEEKINQLNFGVGVWF